MEFHTIFWTNLIFQYGSDYQFGILIDVLMDGKYDEWNFTVQNLSQKGERVILFITIEELLRNATIFAG